MHILTGFQSGKECATGGEMTRFQWDLICCFLSIPSYSCLIFSKVKLDIWDMGSSEWWWWLMTMLFIWNKSDQWVGYYSTQCSLVACRFLFQNIPHVFCFSFVCCFLYSIKLNVCLYIYTYSHWCIKINKRIHLVCGGKYFLTEQKLKQNINFFICLQ